MNHDLQIHICAVCKSPLKDINFSSCGIMLAKPAFFFDYKCEHCNHLGRYIMDLKVPMGPVASLSLLASLMEETEEDDSKGNIKSQLNKIVGVQDLLRLGGDSAPREDDAPRDPTNHDEP